ncbi:hypothetical protein LGM54_30420 [Burkholderia cenocepacia]|uniref:hypothetical protein n=1 Tax=Burkholderia cenocepacia TaxID=95486 RepID=UPI001CF339B7|nr:hypothetical protein [Burkholderia cenocepacia]MCA7967300.1 hypothetical protein [Burkholderia cenocepacia]
MKSKTNQAETAFSNTGPYTTKCHRWHGAQVGEGTLYRDGERVALFGKGNDGEPFVKWFDSRFIVGRAPDGSLIVQQDSPEAMALLAWYRAVEPEASMNDGAAMNAAITRVVRGNILAIETAHMRDMLREKIVWCVPGDVRNGDESPFYAAKPVQGLDVVAAAKEVQQDDPEFVVLNLLPLDAALALYMTLGNRSPALET